MKPWEFIFSYLGNTLEAHQSLKPKTETVAI